MHLLLLALAAPAPAASWTVQADGSGDFPTLSAAVTAAASGDELVLGAGTFAEAVDLGAKDLVITGAGANSTVLDGTGLGRPVVQASGAVTLSGLAVTSTGGQGIVVEGGTMTLSEVRLRDLGSDELDGAAVAVSAGSLVLDGVELDGGQARYGMILLATGTSLLATDSSFEGAEASHGGAIYATGAAVDLSACTFEDLYASVHGGALYLEGGSLEATDTTFYGNLVDSGNGGAIAAFDAPLTLSGGSFELNTIIDYVTGYSGGAIYASGGSLSARATVFTGNLGYAGGAIRATGTDLAFEGVELSDNWAYYGGGLYLDSYAALVDADSEWSGNTGYYGGGAMYVYYRYNVAVSGSTFAGNEATYGYGGGVYLYYIGASTWTDATFQDNYAYYGGGGAMLNSGYATDDFTACTFDDNETYYYGGAGIRAHYYTDLTVTDSSFSGNETELDDGGAVYLVYAGATVSGSTFTGNRALEGMGGAVYSYYAGGNGGEVVLDGNHFQSNEAGYHGGAVASVYDALTVVDNRFEVNDTDSAGMGGALFTMHTQALTARRNLFAGNNAGYGGAVYDDQASVAGATWHNNLFVENTAGIGGAAVISDHPGLTLANNGFVGNSSVDSAGNIGVVSSSLTVVNNVFAHGQAGHALYLWDVESVEDSTFGHNAYYDLADGLVGGELSAAELGEGNLFDLDPLFSAYSPNGDPDDDSFVLLRDSPLIDAGEPSILDPDGSTSDIGPWGGPRVSVQDADGDGADNWVDCDDQDPAATPGNTETWYDGVNGDCLSGSDDDADQDGEDAESQGGTDCDDADPTVQTGCDDGTTTGSGDGGGTDGGAEPGPRPGGGVKGDGCSCGGGAGPTGLLALLAPLLVLRRRGARRPGLR